MYYCSCDVTVRFSDEDVIDNLIFNGEITEEESKNYEVTMSDVREYAWSLIEDDEGEYGDIRVT